MTARDTQIRKATRRILKHADELEDQYGRDIVDEALNAAADERRQY